MQIWDISVASALVRASAELVYARYGRDAIQPRAGVKNLVYLSLSRQAGASVQPLENTPAMHVDRVNAIDCFLVPDEDMPLSRTGISAVVSAAMRTKNAPRDDVVYGAHPHVAVAVLLVAEACDKLNDALVKKKEEMDKDMPNSTLARIIQMLKDAEDIGRKHLADTIVDALAQSSPTSVEPSVMRSAGRRLKMAKNALRKVSDVDREDRIMDYYAAGAFLDELQTSMNHNHTIH